MFEQSAAWTDHLAMAKNRDSGESLALKLKVDSKEQSYVMVAVLDEKGAIIPGFEAEKCVIRDEDRRDIPLKWASVSARQLTGTTIRLRFYIRSAHIYAVTAPSNP